MIEASRLAKRFGTVDAVRDVSFKVAKGEVVGFLGPNGAGKTTTIRMVTGYLQPTGGEAFVNGRSVLESPMETRSDIGYLPENNPLYEDLRVREYLNFRAALKGVPRRKRAQRISEVAGMTETGDVLEKIIGSCSKGYRQRIGLADALLADPPVLILDEPTVGLDPAQIVRTRDLIKALARQHTVVLSTHILPEVEAICSRALIIHRGSLLYDGRVEDLGKNLSGEEIVVCRLAGEPQAAEACLSRVQGVERVEKLDEVDGRPRFHVAVSKGDGAREAIFWACAEARLPLLEMTPQHVSLEEAFLSLTTDETAPVQGNKEAAQ